MSRDMLTSCGIQWFAQRGEVLLPGPLVLERDQLVDIGLAVDDALVGGVTRRVGPPRPRHRRALR